MTTEEPSASSSRRWSPDQILFEGCRDHNCENCAVRRHHMVERLDQEPADSEWIRYLEGGGRLLVPAPAPIMVVDVVISDPPRSGPTTGDPVLDTVLDPRVHAATEMTLDLYAQLLRQRRRETAAMPAWRRLGPGRPRQSGNQTDLMPGFWELSRPRRRYAPPPV